MYPLTGTERARQDIAETFDQYSLMANAGKFIAHRILPIRQVPLAHGTYPVLPLKELMRRLVKDGVNPEGYAARRAPRGAYERQDLGFTQASYITEEHGLEGVVDANEAAHYSNHFMHEMKTAEKIYHDLLLERERRVVSALFNTTRFTPGVAGQSQDAGTYRYDGTLGGSAVKWSDHAQADPIQDIWQAKQKVFDLYGVYPDCMVISEHTLRHLRLSEQIRTEWQALGAGSRAHQSALAPFDHSITGLGHQSISASAIAQVLEVDEIIVGSAVIDANNANDASFSAQQVWGNSALLFKKGTEIGQVCLGHTMQWNGDRSNGDRTTMANSHGVSNAANVVVEDYYEPQTRAQVLRVRHQEAPLIKYNVAELITNVT